MMTEITIVTRNGIDFAMLPLADYYLISEAAETASDAQAILSASRNPQDYIPLELAERIWNGENAIRVWRDHRGMTQAELATACGLARPYIAQLEAGKRQMSVAVLGRLAEALDTDVAFLMPVADAKLH
jgi:DNA-binding XRE family transcriptional regulator